MIMQESSCVILILRIFRFIKLRILVLRCPRNTIFGVLEALKFKIFRSSAPAPLGGGGGGAYSDPPPPKKNPGVSSLGSLGRKDTSLRSDLPPPPNSTTLASWLSHITIIYWKKPRSLTRTGSYRCANNNIVRMSLYQNKNADSKNNVVAPS